MKYITTCDMGNIKIFSENMSCFFDNGVGDVDTKVEIVEKQPKNLNNYEFLGHFSVKKPKSVWLSYYDCSDDKVHNFKVGRWFVYRRKEADIVIMLQDKDIHA